MLVKYTRALGTENLPEDIIITSVADIGPIIWVKVRGKNACSVVSTILAPHIPLILDG